MNNLIVLVTMALVGVVLAAGRPQQHYMDASNQVGNACTRAINARSHCHIFTG